MNTPLSEWDLRWFEAAELMGSWSKDRSRGVGCVFVGSANQILSTGYNGFPRGIEDDVDERHEKPAKFDWTEHAERNAIFNAARSGAKLNGSEVYVSRFPCVACARGIIQVGVVAVITAKPDFAHHRWGREFQVSMEMLTEAGVALRLIQTID